MKSSRLSLSVSLPALPAPAPAASPRTRLIEAFRAADADNSGSISKRELYKVLEDARLGGGANEDFVRMFEGFDVNNDGRLSFEEFSKLANALSR